MRANPGELRANIQLKTEEKGGSKMKAAVDRDSCIGCGNCEAVCPDVFVLDDENKSTVIINLIPKEFEACAKEAAEQCPVNAITIE